MVGLKGVLAEQAVGLRLVNKVLLQPALAAGASCEEDEPLLQDLQSFYQKAEAMLSAAQVRPAQPPDSITTKTSPLVQLHCMCLAYVPDCWSRAKHTKPMCM